MSKLSKKKNVGGVKTKEGKLISRYNSVKHGILRESVADYEEVNVENLYNNLAKDLKPEGSVEELLVEMLATNVIKLQRIAKAEKQFVRDFSSKTFNTNEDNLPVAVADSLLIYSRYQTATENRIFRIIGALNSFKN